MNCKSAVVFFTVFISFSIAHAHVIGTNVPATPLTEDRVANLPDWKSYLETSIRQRQADQDFLHTEMKAYGLTNAIQPPYSATPKGTPLDRPARWYGSAEARRIADCVISFQTPAGGWSKHTDYSRHVRAPGELFAGDNNSRFLITNDFDRPTDVHWNYIGTFDNDATMTELRFLAKVISASGTNTATWQAAFTRGIHYILAAQYPNGGWPQVWPLQGGYHDTITVNDDAVLNLIELMRDVASGQQEFSFVSPALRAQADASWKHGLDCILAAQIRVDGRRTVWCQQHDAITLQPASARNYEMPAATSSESGTIVLFLMQLPDPDSNVVAAVHAAAAWFKKTEIMGKAYRVADSEGRKLVDAPGSGPIWARYYEIGTDRPVFGDRDLTIHDDVNEISRERRNGYGWFRDTGKRVLEHYTNWAKLHPQP
ncbi:MAG TPA: pectate lyase [Candidatus Acidoferrales bacterium]|jgi:PelA/Pel-15E family pectate lyase|nr:pectate lyase [Candidatus Acidoferrales bacterium]